MINTIIVEDNLFMQKHLLGLLSADGRFEIAASVRDAFEAEKLCEEKEIDLVIMDVQTLHNHSGLRSGEKIRALDKGTKVVVVTSLIDPEVLEKSKNGAADSLWYKDYGDSDLMKVIEKTLEGERIFPDTSPSVEVGNMHSAELNERQLEILRMFVRGMTYDEIAKETKLTRNGVRWHLDRIVSKGGFKNKHELLAAVIENKLIVTTLKE